jgi:uncharacterized SAM-binding protein YcdF (DUF218 family)
MKHILLTAGLLALAAAIRLILLSGTGNNTLLLSSIALCLLGYGLFYRRLVKIKWLNITIGLFIFMGLALMGFIAAYGLRGTVTYQEDAVLVLGAGIRGETVSNALAMRLDTALAYHRQNPEARIIVSGGLGRHGDITEALAMERYLAARGVPIDLIYKEEESTSTYENIIYSKIIADGLFNEKTPVIAIITSDFHIFRSMQFAKAEGIRVTHLPAPTLWHTLPVNYIREAAAVIKMWVIGR